MQEKYGAAFKDPSVKVLLIPSGNRDSKGRLVSHEPTGQVVVKTLAFRPHAQPLLVLPVSSVGDLLDLVVVGAEGQSHTMAHA